MSVLSRIIRMAVPIPKIGDFEHYLFVGPHPDDIEIGAGATVAKLASMGKKITFLICLDGRFGMDNAPEGTTPEELVKIRRAESIEAAKLLGVTDVRFLDLCDGGMYSTGIGERDPGESTLIVKMARAIGEIGCDIIFAPDPDVISECHSDHRNVGECVRRLAYFAPFEPIMKGFGAEPADVKAVAFYMTARVNRTISTRGMLKKQYAAIDCHRSQYPVGCADRDSLRLYLKLRTIYYGLKSFKGRAEGFRVLSRVHMHCLPEAGE